MTRCADKHNQQRVGIVEMMSIDFTELSTHLAVLRARQLRSGTPGFAFHWIGFVGAFVVWVAILGIGEFHALTISGTILWGGVSLFLLLFVAFLADCRNAKFATCFLIKLAGRPSPATLAACLFHKAGYHKTLASAMHWQFATGY